jgi:hypothetical protein
MCEVEMAASLAEQMCLCQKKNSFPFFALVAAGSAAWSAGDPAGGGGAAMRRRSEHMGGSWTGPRLWAEMR